MNQITVNFDAALHLNIALASMHLCDIQPIVNGTCLSKPSIQILHQAREALILQYQAQELHDGRFYLAIQTNADEHLAQLQYWLEEYTEPLDSFGIHIATIENLRAYLRNGYHSWDGAFYVEPESLLEMPLLAEPEGPFGEVRVDVGYAMTQLLPRHGADCALIGFDRHDRFQQQFQFATQQPAPALTITTLWDRQDVGEHLRCASEHLLIFAHTGIEAGLRAWGQRVAAASPLPPRVHGPPITGWSSWYNLYTNIDEAAIREQVHGAAEVVQREQLPMRIFQVDDGFTPEMGDWLEVKPGFPQGIAALLAEIRATGFTPGLWIAPFMVGNRSHLFRDHPDWVLRDAHTDEPVVQWRRYGEQRSHQRSEDYYILDTTHPAAFAYLRQVFQTWRHEWRCAYFKIDFLFWGAAYGPERVRRYTPGKSRIAIWHDLITMIRDAVGDAEIVGCGCPIWAAIGLMEAVRIGGDVGVAWAVDPSPQSLLRDLTARSFANHLLWQIDPDCVLLRERYHYLTPAEVRSLAIFAGMAGGVMMTSDTLQDLSPERLALWKSILTTERASADYPLLGESPLIAMYPSPQQGGVVLRALDPVLVQMRAPHTAAGIGAVFCFNIGEHPVQRSYSWEALGIVGARYICDWMEGRLFDGPQPELAMTLAPHTGKLIFFSTTPLTAVPTHLP